MAPHISLHGKWQQMNLSKPTENKGRQQQKGLQRHHWVCCLLGCILLLPRPFGKLQRAWVWGNGVPQCLQDEPLLPLGLPPTAPGTGQVKFVSTLVSRVRAGKHLGWESQQSLFHLVFFLSSSFPWDMIIQRLVLLRGILRLTSSEIYEGSLFSPKP